MAEARKKEAAQVAAFDKKQTEAAAVDVKENACAAKGQIFNGKECIMAAGTTVKHPSETMTVTCNKDYSTGT